MAVNFLVDEQSFYVIITGRVSEEIHYWREGKLLAYVKCNR